MQMEKSIEKLLPLPNLSSLILPSSSKSNTLRNQVEERVHNIWCQVLRHDGRQISTNANFFSIGGHSLLFIELYGRYQSLFGFDSRLLSMSLFLQQPTIVQHSQLLQTVSINQIKSIQWHSLHINQGNKL